MLDGAQDTGGECQDGTQQVEYAVYRDSDDAEGKGQQPCNRVEHQGQQSSWPVDK